MLYENFFPFIVRKKRNSSRQNKVNKLRVDFRVARNYLCIVGLFIYVRVHVVVEHVPQAQHSTAQHNTTRRNQHSQAANHIRADQSATTQSDRVGQRKHVLEHLQKQTETSKCGRPTQNTTTHKAA